ncbi:MAG: EboA domain-containing protein [Bacteroidota bacterium]
MKQITFQANIDESITFLTDLLPKKVDYKSLDWLNEKTAMIRKNPLERNIFLNFSLASRFFSKDIVEMNKEEIAKAQNIRKGFQPHGWNALQIARTIILLNIPYENPEKHLSILNALFEAADVAELTALYAALPLLSNPEMLTKRAAEGIRTNMTVVLDAIVLNNPYPSEFLDEVSWNQLVLKTIFTERPVHQIYGGDDRANKKLALTLSDYAHERWAAGRAVTPELWRYTGKFTNNTLLKDLERLLKNGNAFEQAAAKLVCKDSENERAMKLLADCESDITTTYNNWDALGKAYLASKGELPSGYQQAGSGVSASN